MPLRLTRPPALTAELRIGRQFRATTRALCDQRRAATLTKLRIGPIRPPALAAGVICARRWHILLRRIVSRRTAALIAIPAVVTAAMAAAVAFPRVAAQASEQTLEKTHDSCSTRFGSCRLPGCLPPTSLGCTQQRMPCKSVRFETLNSVESQAGQFRPRWCSAQCRWSAAAPPNPCRAAACSQASRSTWTVEWWMSNRSASSARSCRTSS